jgi:hypothetical protein
MRPQVACGEVIEGHLCVADEHYVATVLAVYGMHDSVDGIGLSTFADWYTGSPRTFGPGQAGVPRVARWMRSRLGPAKCVHERSSVVSASLAVAFKLAHRARAEQPGAVDLRAKGLLCSNGRGAHGTSEGL